MKPFRFSIRGLILAVAVVGFDAAAMIRAFRMSRTPREVSDYVTGFGLVLLLLNLLIFGLHRYFAGRADLPASARLNSRPPVMVMFGLYAAVLSVAILSVLFLSSGKF
jgi:hypothetical protein